MKIGFFDGDDRIRSFGHGRAGHDADTLFRLVLSIEGITGIGGTNAFKPGYATCQVSGLKGITIHGRVGMTGYIEWGGHIFGQNTAKGCA